MKVKQIAEIVKGEVQGEASREIRGVARLEDASDDQLAFAENNHRALALAAGSQAGCILVSEGALLPGRTAIAVSHPKLAFIQAAEVLHPALPPSPGIHPSAVVSPEARLSATVSVGPGVVIEPGVRVGEATRLAAGVFVGQGVEIGAHCVLYPHVTIYEGCRVGNNVVLHAGVVVGADGFGYVMAGGRHWKFPQVGEVVIEDDVEIGCNTTVDRGSLGITVIGEGTKIDNLVQIAHNVRIGKHCVIAAQTGISGSTTLGDYVVIAGQVGIGEGARIEKRAVIGGQAGVLPGKVVREGATLWGTPARPLAEFKKLYAYFASLPELARKVRDLSRRHF
jgi:UDP-3-O-[3-hydroxymyristoyl] glucosamine N-acyltransferase